MPDLSQLWGTDLRTDSTGDLQVISGPALGQQRVLRRLLTNPGEYIWQTGYGAGLARFIGQPASALQISAVIRSQIFKESSVAKTPEPVIEVDVSPTGDPGSVYVHIRYVDAPSGETQILSFPVNT